MKPRGYSTAFKPKRNTGRAYMLGNIPAGLWTAVRRKCRREGVSTRAVILELLTAWLEDRTPLRVVLPPDDADAIRAYAAPLPTDDEGGAR